MIVFDLNCTQGHRFEAWFGSSADYEEQKARGLVACPLCGDADVVKAVMAPAVTAKGNQRNSDRSPSRPDSAQSVATMPAAAAERMQALITQLAQAQAHILADSLWVGDSFADRARAMHYGEEPAASIHGVTDRSEARALMEEGIVIAPLPIPIVPPDECN